MLSAPDVAWSLAPAAVAYQWLRDGVPIEGATSASYQVAAADEGHLVSLRFHSTNGWEAWFVVTTETSVSAEIGAVPVNLVAPSIAGKVRVGKRVRALPGEWSKVASYRYAWFVKGKLVGTASTLKLKKVWKGKRLRLRVTAVRPGCALGVAYSSRVRIR